STPWPAREPSSPLTSAAFRKSSRTAGQGSSWLRAITRPWPTQSSGCLETMRRVFGWEKPVWRASRQRLPSSGWLPGPQLCTRAWPAEPTQRTPRARRSPGCAERTAEAAGVHHSEMAQRIVVFDRIVRIEPAQRQGNVARHSPAGAGVPGQTQAPPDADDVRIERDDKLGWRHTRPDAEVQRIASN